MTKRIAAPVETVFEVASDLQRAAEHIRGIDKIELLTTLPVCVGTRWRETRTIMGRQDTQTLEVTRFDPPQSYSVGCDFCGSYMETTFRFAAMTGDETDLTLEVKCEARTLMAKLMSPIGNMMFGSMMRKCIGDDLDDIEREAKSRLVHSQPANDPV